MAREKRTKPCSNCKRSKVKCEYTDTLPCARCISIGHASSCQFIPKLPSLKLPLLSGHPVQNNYPGLGVTQPHALPIAPTLHIRPVPTLLVYLQSSQAPGVNRLEREQNAYTGAAKSMSRDELNWKTSLESRLDSFDTKFSDLVDTLKENQRALVAERELNRFYSAQNEHLRREARNALGFLQNSSESPTSYSEEDSDRKRALDTQLHPAKRVGRAEPEDFRGSLLTLEEAKMLFDYFDSNISQQLFGFEILKFSVESMWETSPILICAICTIASMHYPDQRISSKQELLQKNLHRLCAELLFQGKPQTEREGFNTIVALVLCSFWLSDSQRFTGLALQLAKEFEMNKPSTGKDALSKKDRLKLWYLLYILDGQQSMTFNRQSLISSDDYSLRHSRELLLDTPRPQITASQDTPEQRETKAEEKNRESAVSHPRDYTSFTDLRLVSQVEYNQALNEAFKGSAWDLIAPSGFGIPSKSNLELDKWMVSWTVLLAPRNNGPVWLSKSTLIYYNFAKMHINSTLIRQLQVATGDSNVNLPNWDNIDSVLEQNRRVHVEEVREHTDEEDDDEEEDENQEDNFIHNSEMVTQDQAILHLNIAMNAAQTVLNLVLNDADILNNLKYVPVHIHVMLYYAALLLVNRPMTNGNKAVPKNEVYFRDHVQGLRMVKTLQNKISANFPTDKNFGHRLVASLDNVFLERVRRLKDELSESAVDVSAKASLFNEISILLFTNKLEVVDYTDANSKESSPGQERISAWPGSQHGHP